MLEQIANDVVVSLLCCLMKRRVLRLGLGRHECSVLDEEADHVELSEVARHVQRRVASLGLCVDLCTVVEQFTRNLDAIFLCA